MVYSEVTFWGIHGGKTGDADTLFLKNNYVAIGWSKLGSLNVIPVDREAFKAKLLECYPEKKPGAIPNNAGQLLRFLHEMKVGDIIV